MLAYKAPIKHLVPSLYP